MHPEIALCSEQAAGDRNPSVPQLHHSRHTLLLGQYHSLSHILLQPLWHLCEGRTTARFHNIGYISVTRQFISPNEPVQGSTEPPQCAPAASTSASGVLCIPHLQYTRECTCEYRQNTEANFKETFKPSEHSKLFLSVTKLASTCTRISFSPKERHGAKIFYQSESNKFITSALFKLSKSPTAKNVNSFWHEIPDLVENCWASATPGSAFQQQHKVSQSSPQIISSFSCILKIF